MSRLVALSGDALTVVGTLSPVPFVATAGVLIQGITRACDEVAICKERSRSLALKASSLREAIDEQAKRLNESELRELVDAISPVLERVLVVMREVSAYSLVKALYKRSDIQTRITQCNDELGGIMDRFKFESAIILHDNVRALRENQQRDAAEVQELLLRILSSPALRLEAQREADSVKADIMETGQGILRREAPSSNRQGEVSKTAEDLQRGLLAFHQELGVPPSIKLLNGEVKKCSDMPFTGGARSEVWVGNWMGGQKVALKALRHIRSSDARAKERFIREINVWSNLKHDHILSFYGVVTDLGLWMHTVSPWQENGDVLDYLKKHQGANRLHLLAGAAEGLAYLHTQKVVHGNVKCANILVSSKGEACICDFGMAKVIEEITEEAASTTLHDGSARWLAPELLDGRISSPSHVADVYSFGMTTWELMEGKQPFWEVKRTTKVVCLVVNERRTPVRPDGRWVSDELWGLMTECWRWDADERPSMSRVAGRIREIEGGTESGRTYD